MDDDKKKELHQLAEDQTKLIFDLRDLYEGLKRTACMLDEMNVQEPELNELRQLKATIKALPECELRKKLNKFFESVRNQAQENIYNV